MAVHRFKVLAALLLAVSSATNLFSSDRYLYKFLQAPGAEKAPRPEDTELATLLGSAEQALVGGYSWKAEQLFSKALKMAESRHGAENLYVSDAALGMALTLNYMGKADEVESLLKRCLALREKLLGAEDPELLPPLMMLARQNAHRWETAQAYAQRGLAIARRTEETDERRLYFLFGLEGACVRGGRHAEAEAYCREIIKAHEKLYAAPNQSTVLTQARLTAHLFHQGRSIEADRHAQSVLATLRAREGIDRLVLVQYLGCIGEHYQNTGRFAEAARFYEESRGLHTAAEKNWLAWTLQRLAECKHAQGDLAEAEKVYIEALALKKALRVVPRIQECHEALAEIYKQQMRWKDAEYHLRQSLLLHEKHFGKTHIGTAKALTCLASLFDTQKRYEDALPIHTRSLEIYTARCHPDNYMLMNGHLWVARTLGFLGRRDESLDRYREILQSIGRARRHVFATRSEAGKLEWAEQHRGWYAYLFSLAAEMQERRPEVVNWVHEEAANLRGMVLESQMTENEAAAAGDDPELLALTGGIREVRKQIAQWVTQPLPEGREKQVQETYEGLNAKLEELQIALAHRSKRFAVEQDIQKGSLDAIQKALPEDAALVSLVVADDRVLDPEKGPPAWSYYAIVLTRSGASPMVRLGHRDQIEAWLREFRNAIAAQGVGKKEWRTPLAKLGQALVEPIWPLIGKYKRLILQPEGSLATLPWSCLPRPGGDGALVDSHEVVLVSSSREVLRWQQAPPLAKGAVILADPDFEATTAAAEPAADLTRYAALKGRNWSRLPGTRAEADVLALLFKDAGWPVSVKTGPEATKEALWQADAPRVLHLATHGFYLRPPKPSPVGEEHADDEQERTAEPEKEKDRGLAGIKEAKPAPEEISVPAHPLLRSGLILAGANREAGLSSGAATAYELMGLDLWGTELVVLSACETGLGDIELGEGVMGLQRAFLQSGARTLLTSLWKIPDAETKDLMAAFYKRKLKGKPAATALREAMLEIRAGLAGGEKDHPYYWGAFVLVGNPD